MGHVLSVPAGSYTCGSLSLKRREFVIVKSAGKKQISLRMLALYAAD